MSVALAALQTRLDDVASQQTWKLAKDLAYALVEWKETEELAEALWGTERTEKKPIRVALVSSQFIERDVEIARKELELSLLRFGHDRLSDEAEAALAVFDSACKFLGQEASSQFKDKEGWFCTLRSGFEGQRMRAKFAADFAKHEQGVEPSGGNTVSLTITIETSKKLAGLLSECCKAGDQRVAMTSKELAEALGMENDLTL